MSWKPEVFVAFAWSHNQLVFATKDEAERCAHDLFMRWTLCEDSRAVESELPVTHVYVNGEVIPCLVMEAKA